MGGLKSMKEMVRIVDNSKPRKTVEEKQYLICLTGMGQDDWIIVEGRTEAYEYIKNAVHWIDFENSFVLVENLSLAERKSVYAFLKHVQDNYDDGFDIDEYIESDREEEFRASNIDSSVNINSDERLDMASFMDGTITTENL